MFIMLLVDARYNGAKIPAGEVIELDDASAMQLISEGSAEGPLGNPEGVPTGEGTPGKQNDLGGNNGTPEGGNADADSEEVAKLKRALDGQYKKDDLVEAAQNVGIEFPVNATKAVIIDAAVAQGKAAALLK
jgi:hypothetical protein